MAPARNRVTPLGDIVAIPLRGAWTGNRGILHAGREIVRFHAGNLWITCRLRFRGRRHEQWQPRHYTFLSFHDEAVSFAAGHRPCAECRRASYDAYRAAWAEGLGVDLPSARAMNERLHAERIVRGTHRRRLHDLPWAHLPDGAFVLLGETPVLVAGGGRSSGRVRAIAAAGRGPRAEPRASSHRRLRSRRCAPATRSRSTTAPAAERRRRRSPRADGAVRRSATGARPSPRRGSAP